MINNFTYTEFSLLWVCLGFLGWCLLTSYRHKFGYTDTNPAKKKATWVNYIAGFIFALILGPICLGYFSWLEGKRKQATEDQD